MRALVFYHRLSEEDRAVLNGPEDQGGGWSGEVGSKYFSAQQEGLSEDNVEFFELAASIELKEKANESVWNSLQNGWGGFESWGERVSAHQYTDFPRSMSIGDYVFWSDGSMYRAESLGFRDATDEERKLLARVVSNHLLKDVKPNQE